MDGVSTVTEGLTDDEQGNFTPGKECRSNINTKVNWRERMKEYEKSKKYMRILWIWKRHVRLIGRLYGMC